MMSLCLFQPRCRLLGKRRKNFVIAVWSLISLMAPFSAWCSASPVTEWVSWELLVKEQSSIDLIDHSFFSIAMKLSVSMLWDAAGLLKSWQVGGVWDLPCQEISSLYSDVCLSVPLSWSSTVTFTSENKFQLCIKVVKVLLLTVGKKNYPEQVAVTARSGFCSDKKWWKSSPGFIPCTGNPGLFLLGISRFLRQWRHSKTSHSQSQGRRTWPSCTLPSTKVCQLRQGRVGTTTPRKAGLLSSWSTSGGGFTLWGLFLLGFALCAFSRNVRCSLQ